ncbi:carbon-nitrogen hydrolase family protein [Humibacillus xanthopallidus]|uniref:Carbon-nitrogen hydrolase n=1 Tax=Humibacillus xanthopallidus TaxID=412689 RepID=A0A543HGK9_9MICO|nr:carbon-nitrogen hydrolase family protein [Humibacillus xanthopallidus]TQM57460.1 carbon-nitrogen hydrolase [Humibacillus xanthopallidus]
MTCQHSRVSFAIATCQPTASSDPRVNGGEMRRMLRVASAASARLVDRCDKRKCSHTEVTQFYTPGFEPVVFDVDGFRFGLAICIEINFSEVFAEYDRLGVDCLLLSAYPVDSVFATKARAYAAIHNYWVSLSVPAQTTYLFHSGLIGPHGEVLADVGGESGLVVGTLDRADPALCGALESARPWRARARVGDIYEERRVTDERSRVRTEF